jgi:predicted nucleic acid-binding protein
LSDAGFLVATNVISETRKERPEPNVVAFVQSAPREGLFVSALTIGELRKGATLVARRNRIEGILTHEWIDEVEEAFGDRVLSVNAPIARRWGELAAMRSRPVIDTLLAATAIEHGLTLVTRNTRDLADTGVALMNPWQREH